MQVAISSYFCPRCGTRRGTSGACERDHEQLVPITADSLLGTELGNYVLVQRLGEGGMGAVYRAVQPKIGAEVAIKVLHASPGDQAHRFLLEAQAVNRVRHGNLIRILDTGYLSDRRPYLVMELLDGMSLADAVGVISPPLAARVAAEVLDALDAVHREGIVHRDLKPPNVYLTSDGRVVVLDFGIAKLVDGEVITHSSGMVGTPEYMAPEQIRAQPVDRRTDIYAIGVMLYETITGRRPFAAAATFDMLVQHLEQPPTSPREFAPNLSPALADVILRAMEKQPDRRFQTAAEMAAALRDTQTATRDDLVAFVTQRAHTRPPVPIESRPAESATADERPSAPRPRDGASATRREIPANRGSNESARSAARPVAHTLRSFAPHVAIGVVLAAVVTWVILRTPDRPAKAPATTTPILAPTVAVQQVVPAAPADAAIDAPTEGVIEVTSTPAGAEVTIDHVARGKTPVTIVLHAGAHLLHAELAGHVAIDEALEARAGERSSVILALPSVGGRGTASQHVTSHPIGDDLMEPGTVGRRGSAAADLPTSGEIIKDTNHAAGSTTGSNARKPNPFTP